MLRKIVLVSFIILGVLMLGSRATADPGDVITVVDSSATMTDASMVLNSSGNPVIAYSDLTNSDLKIAICGNPTCTSKTIRTLDSSMYTSYGPGLVSLALNSSGNPVVAYKTALQGITVVQCLDATCSVIMPGPEIFTPNPSYISLVLTAGNLPRIIYKRPAAGVPALELHVCSDPICVLVESGIPIDDPVDDGIYDIHAGEYNSLALTSSGYPVMSYYEETGQNLKMAFCLTYNCAQGTIIYRKLDLAGNVGTHTSMRLLGGNPIVAYKDESNDTLKLARCSDSQCIVPPTITTLDDMGSTGGQISLGFWYNNLPIISFRHATEGLKLVTCYSTTCSAREIRSIDSATGSRTSVAWHSGSGRASVAYTGGGLKLVTIAPGIIVTPSDTPNPPAPPNVAEAGSRTFKITLHTRPTQNVTIPISVSSSQCIVNTSSVLMTPSNWDTGVNVTVSGVAEFIDDGNQSCNLITGDPTSADSYYNALTSADSPNIGITIIDDDTAGITVTPSSAQTIAETGNQQFTFKLTSQPLFAVNIPISVSSAQCTVSSALISLNSSTWSSGATVTVSGAPENIDDGNQPCNLISGDPSSSDSVYNALTAMDSPDVNITITDDDTAGFSLTPDTVPTNPPSPNVAEAGSRGFTFRLHTQPLAPVTIPISVSSGQCMADVSSVILSSANWNTGARVIVSGVVESIDDGNQRCDLISGDPTSSDPVYNAKTATDTPNQVITIIDDDGGITVTPSGSQNIGEASFRDFTFKLTSAPTANVTIPLSVSSGQCSVNVSSVVLGTGNWSTGAVARVSGVSEDVIDGNQPCNLISGDPTSTDPVYDILTAGNSPDVNITILDDDSAGINLTPESTPAAPPPPNVAEAGSRNFIFTLDTIPTAAVTFPVSVSDTTQCSSDVTSVVLDSGNWDTGAAAQISGVPEMVQDGNQPCTLITGDPTSADPNYNMLNVSDSPDITFFMIDDDTVGVSVTPSSTPASPPPPNVAEAGFREFTVTLNSQPTDDVLILVSVSDTSQCTVDNGVATLTTSTWNTGFVVTVSGVVESLDDGDQPCNLITGDVLSNDSNYDALGAGDTPDINITIIDDDPIDTPTPTGPAALVASAVCNVENLEVTITAGDGPFDITASAGINTPVLGVALGTTTIFGPEKWDNLTVTETSGDTESINLGQFKCRTDERPTPLTPAHRERTTNTFPVFSWTAVSFASNYRVFVFDNKVVADRTVDIRENSGGATSYTLSQPLPLGRLFWRVRARTNRVWGLWSERFTLFIDPTVVAPMTPVPTIDLSGDNTSPQTPPTPIALPTFPAPPNSR